MNKIWLDGHVTSENEAPVSTLSHALARGSAVFDVLSIHATQKGPAVFRLPEHVHRFMRSASLIGLPLRWEADQLEQGVLAAVRASALDAGLVRLMAFITSAEPDLVPRDPRISVAAFAYDQGHYEPQKIRAPLASLQLRIEPEMRKASAAVFPPHAKVAGAYIGPMLARQHALRDGFDEVLLLDEKGNVAEAPTANFFAVIDGALHTPPLGFILDGITRESVMQVALEEGIAMHAGPLTPASLGSAREAFLTSTSLVIAPISALDAQPLPDGTPGPITQRLMDRMRAIQTGHDTTFAHWLTHVGGPILSRWGLLNKDKAPTAHAREVRGHGRELPSPPRKLEVHQGELRTHQSELEGQKCDLSRHRSELGTQQGVFRVHKCEL